MACWTTTEGYWVAEGEGPQHYIIVEGLSRAEVMKAWIGIYRTQVPPSLLT